MDEFGQAFFLVDIEMFAGEVIAVDRHARHHVPDEDRNRDLRPSPACGNAASDPAKSASRTVRPCERANRTIGSSSPRTRARSPQPVSATRSKPPAEATKTAADASFNAVALSFASRPATRKVSADGSVGRVAQPHERVMPLREDDAIHEAIDAFVERVQADAEQHRDDELDDGRQACIFKAAREDPVDDAEEPDRDGRQRSVHDRARAHQSRVDDAGAQQDVGDAQHAGLEPGEEIADDGCSARRTCTFWSMRNAAFTSACVHNPTATHRRRAGFDQGFMRAVIAAAATAKTTQLRIE